VLETTCVDAVSAERCIITQADQVPLLDAVAASCSVPGFAAPQRIGDRLCMDGGMVGTGVHLDRVAGATRALIISLDGAAGLPEAGLTIASGAAEHERASLEASGTSILHLHPEAAEVGEMMSPRSIPAALAMGARQGEAEVEAVRAFWR
jgi:NTE family protein